MKVSYSGKHERLEPALQKKLQARYAKLGKLLDSRSEKEARVVLTSERHLRCAEITVNYYDHPLVGIHSAKDSFDAVMGACDKLEKQILKHRDRWRDTKRKSAPREEPSAPVAEETPEEAPAEPRVFRVGRKSIPKPMTVDEAILEINQKKSYVVYRDSETDRISVLVRRPDGHYDLIEA